MRLKHELPAKSTLKLQAKRLRFVLARQGQDYSHSQSLELIAKQWGFTDWNTLNAALKPKGVSNSSFDFLGEGDRVKGEYCGLHYSGTVLDIVTLGNCDAYTVTILFDVVMEPPPEIQPPGPRNQVTFTVGSNGETVQKMKSGKRYLTIHL